MYYQTRKIENYVESSCITSISKKSTLQLVRREWGGGGGGEGEGERGREGEEGKLNLKCIISIFVYHTTMIYKWILGFIEKIGFTEKIGVLFLFKNGESMKVGLGLRCINQMFGGFQSRGTWSFRFYFWSGYDEN